MDLQLKEQGFFLTGNLTEPSKLISQVKKQLDLSGEYQIVLALFPFSSENDDTDTESRIAPFARANYYKDIIKRMKNAILSSPPPLSGLSKSQYRLFCNSRLPEKAMAYEAGLGFLGKNSLLITEERGSSCLIGGMILPSCIKLTHPQIPSEMKGCGSCRLCINACPSGAINDDGFNRENCIQSWTTDSRPVPDEIKSRWGNRIYGCTVCQDVCPWNRKIPSGVRISRGLLPEKIPLEFFITASEKEIQEFFRGTTLGMNWLKPALLKRNALLCAVSADRRDLQPLIEAMKGSSDSETLEESRLWALKRLK